MTDDLVFVIDPETGLVESVYDDAALPILAGLGGENEITRASHVEPHPFSGGWIADMGPSGGPVLFADGECPHHEIAMWGFKTFPTRAEALAAEREWLRVHRGL